MDSTDFHKLLLSRGTFFCYSGLLSEEVLSAISGIVREQVTDIAHAAALTTRVFGIFMKKQIFLYLGPWMMFGLIITQRN